MFLFNDNLASSFFTWSVGFKFDIIVQENKFHIIVQENSGRRWTVHVGTAN